jgi:hypothetical protein
VSGWIQRSVSSVPERKPSFLEKTRAISLWEFQLDRHMSFLLWEFTENSACGSSGSVAFCPQKKGNGTRLLHRDVNSSRTLLTSNMPGHEGLRQKRILSLAEEENRITVGAHHANYLFQLCFLV